MPRTLPWLLEQNREGRVKRESTPRKRVKREPAPDSDITPKKPPSSPDKKEFFRSSQTPPTSPAQPCPPEEYLVGGLDHDDAWIMVEDEFYAVAQSFTQHLHYAEYVRRKKEVKAQSTAAIGDMERPTDGKTAMPKDLQRRKDAEELAARQKAGLEQVEGQEENTNGDGTDDDDDTWAGTHLHELINSPRKLRSLVGARELKPSTRAAAGFAQAPSVNSSRSQLAAGSPPAALSRAMAVQVMEVDNDETASEDDDLDGQVYPAAMPPTAQPERDASPEIPEKSDFRIQCRRQNDPKKTPTFEEANPSSTGISATQTPKFKSRVQSLFDDLDELPEPPRLTKNSDKKREVSPAEDTTKVSSEDNNLTPKSRFKDVPTFLV